jgi:VWFA-related protein
MQIAKCKLQNASGRSRESVPPTNLHFAFCILHFAISFPMRVGVIVLVVAAIGVPASAQQTLYEIKKEQVQKDGQSQDRLYLTRRPDPQGKPTLYVTVQFKIVRPDGQLAEDVSPDEIVVEEDRQRVGDLKVQAPSALDSLTTVLAIDISGSMAEHGKMEQAKQAANRFLDRLHGRADCGLILFDHDLRVRKPPAGQLQQLATGRQQLRQLIREAQPGGGTAYLDATAEALSMLRGAKGRKAVVLLTDGVDLNSRYTAAEVMRLSQGAGVPVYTVGVGEPGKNEPVNTVLVLDHSDSMRDVAEAGSRLSKIKALHRAASRFVDLMRPGALTTLLPFNHQIDTPRPFSADKTALKKRIQQLTPSGGTLLYDATYQAVETLEAARPDGKKAVVVLTDGVDESPGSRHRVAEVIQRAREAGIPLHMLGFGQAGDLDEDVMRQMASQTGGTYHHARNEQLLFSIFENLSIQLHDDGIDEAALRKLADETGGRYFHARDLSQLNFIYEGLADELQTTYTVTFPSLRQDYDGTSRDINISVWRKGTQVSTVLQEGYNVPGVVVPEMEPGVYILLLAALGGLLAVPAVLRRLSRPDLTAPAAQSRLED